MRLRLPEERPAEPPAGHKIAYALLARDGGAAAFLGVSLGGGRPYGVLAEAACAYGRRHAPPVRRCDCGFHCLHDRAEAAGLTCTAEHRGALLLEVAVLGRYIRFERGMRYARQRVRTATAGPCRCGRAASVLADAGWGRPGWTALEPACAACAGARAAVTPADFAKLAGEGLRVRTAPGAVTAARAPGLSAVELAAEATLLQARLDWFQAQLARMTGSGGNP